MEREPSRDFISTAHSSPRAEVNEAVSDYWRSQGLVFRFEFLE